jgi:phage gp36-like protein
MPYATPEDVLASWNKVHTSGLTNDEIRTMISRAGNIIDAYLAIRYTVPFATDPSNTPGLIKDLTCDLALLDVFDRQPNTPDWIVRRIQRAYDLLTALQNEQVSLPGVGENTETGVPRSNTEGYTPVFGARPSLREQIDPNRSQTERDARQPFRPDIWWP